MAKRKPTKKTKAPKAEGLVRLNKLLAAHGHGSRRACEEFIVEGRVEVDGKVVEKLGTSIDPEKQKVTLDGERIIQQKLQYFMLNKPTGVLSTSSDPSGRIRVIDLIKTNSRVYNVGRLDKSSEGLILVTNDGDLANCLTHPRYGVEKKYHVTVAGKPGKEQLTTLKKGVYLAEAFVQVSNVRVKKQMRDRTILEIILDEGRNREIRRLLARVGHKVTQLKRVAIGPLSLGELPTGSHRPLTTAEIKLLKKFATDVGAKPAKKKAVRKKRAVSSAARSGPARFKKARKKSRPGKGRPSKGLSAGRKKGGATKKRTSKKSSKKRATRKRAR